MSITSNLSLLISQIRDGATENPLLKSERLSFSVRRMRKVSWENNDDLAT